MLKEVLIDHNDLDGAGCRIVFSIANMDKVNGEDFIIVNCSNNNVDDKVKEVIQRDDVNPNETSIYFSDITAGREVLEELKEAGYKMMIWDHHRTNFFATWVIPDAIIIPENDMGKLESGTSLIFQYYAKEFVDTLDSKSKYFDKKLFVDLVENIRSYDTYEFKETDNLDAKKLNLLFFMLGIERFCKRYIKRILSEDNNDDLFTDSDNEFIDARLENEERIIESIGKDHVYDVSIKGYKAAFIVSTGGANISEVSYQFLKKYPEYDIMIGYSFYLDGGAYSFRCTRDDIDLGKDIAYPIGGGGHPKASGAPIPEAIKDQIVNILLGNIDPNYEIGNNDF